jgi:hypothetical protein
MPRFSGGGGVGTMSVRLKYLAGLPFWKSSLDCQRRPKIDPFSTVEN